MLTRIEFTEGSIRTLSFSFLEIVRGLRRTSFDVLLGGRNQRTFHQDIVVEFVPAFDLRLVVAFYHLYSTA
jgi:hypothetical protein